MPKDIIIGVDGGGSKTHCVIIERPTSTHADIKVEDINILAESYSGSTNANSVGDEKAKTELLKAITDALAQIKEEYTISAIGLGMSGVDRPSDKEKVQRWLQEEEKLKSVQKVSINNDAVAALCSGTMGKIEPGKSVVVISGTGCICVGYDSQSNWVRAGGWGPLLGDEGSGYAIGSMVLQHVCHQHDGVPSLILGETVEAEPKSQLFTCVLEALKLKEATELIPYVYGKSQEWSTVAAVAPIAFDCSKKGDKLALLILRYQSQALFKYIERVMQRLATKEQPALIQDYRIVIAGSILTHEHSPITQMVGDLLRINYPKAKLLSPVVTPAIGSALYAAQN